MPRKKSEAVPEGNDPIPPNTYVLPGITAEDFRRMMYESMDKCFDKYIVIVRKVYGEPFRSTGEIVGRDSGGDGRGADQREASQEQEARQSRLAMEADGPAKPRLASARRALLQQYKRCMGIAFLLAGLVPARRPTRPVSA